MTKTQLAVLAIPAFIIGVFISRGPHVIVSLNSALGSHRYQPLDLPKCEPDPQGNIDQQIYLNEGSTKSYAWAEVAGCVSRPFLDTWGVTHNPNEMGMVNHAQAIVKVISPPPAGATHLYRVTYTIQNVFNVTFTLDWLHQLLQGTLSDPREVLITVTKYSGSSLIGHFSGAIRLLKISPQVTLAAGRLEVKAPSINKEKVGAMASEIITRLRVGTPYWEGLTSSDVIDFD